ncbi:hypothetical protein RDABS01_014231 [Bienertia sinuspersici]
MEDRIPMTIQTNLTPISFLIWNTQGAGNQAFVSALKEVVRCNKPTVIALMETHMDGEYAESLLPKIGFNGHLRVDAEGFSGGIWLYWKREIINVGPINKSTQYLTVEISRNCEEPWFFTAIYANARSAKKNELWQFLKDFAQTHNKPWMLSGDFNDTRFGWERNVYSAETSRRTSLFNAWVGEMELIELEFSDPSHTWARGVAEESRKSARLDSTLCNSDWGLRFSDATVKHLPAIQSDHCPLLISPNGFSPLNVLNKPFRFQAAWLTHEKFQEFVHSKWSNDKPLTEALSSLSNDLQIWNKEKSLAINYNISLIKLEGKLRHELDETLFQEELLWYQRARVDWIKDGDRNTSFFHLSTIIKSWKNKIVALKDDQGTWITNSSDVKEHIMKYFQALYQEDKDQHGERLPMHCFPQLLDRWDVIITHCYREANFAADWCANKGINQATPIQVFDSPPSDLVYIINADALGIAWSRGIAM